MWIKTCDGELVNLDNCIQVKSNGSRVWTVESCDSESAILTDLFRGTPEQCGKYIDELLGELTDNGHGIEPEHLPGWVQELEGGNSNAN